MAKKNISMIQIVLICVAAVGLILAIVGIAVPWYTLKAESIVGSGAENFGLFADYGSGTDMSIALVQSFAIITLILTIAACVVLSLNLLGVVKIKWIYRVICAAVVIVFALLTLIFAIVYANQYGSAEMFGAKMSFTAGAGAYLLPIGAVISLCPSSSAKTEI